MSPEFPLRSRICRVNWCLVVLLAAFLTFIHFIFFSGNEIVSLRKPPSNSQPSSASAHSAPKTFFDWHHLKAASNASAHSAHSAVKNFFDWHNLKPAKKLAPGPHSEESGSSNPVVTASQKSASITATASTISDELVSTNVASPLNDSLEDEIRVIDGISNSTLGTGKGIQNTGDGNTTEEYVAICLGVKDQARDLGEWLTHHYHHVGIKRFYIMDDGSEPPLSTMNLNHSIPESAITHHYQDRSTRAGAMQIVFYAQCNEWYGKNHMWIAYIDADEYLEVTSKNETLEDILRSFEPDEMVGALGVNWKMHTSAGLLKRPDSCRQAFTTCLNETYEGTHHEDHIKSIVKTSFFGGAQNPHKFGLRDGAMTVGENGDVIETIAWRVPPTRDRIALHHYAVKSKEEYEEKILRSNGMSDPKNEVFWNHVENLPHLECKEMAQYDP